MMKKDRGFTLIEVIAAMTIISIGLISLLALFPTGIGVNQLSVGTTRATILCKSMMQEIKKAASSTWDENPANLVLLGDENGNDLHTLRFSGDEWCSFGKYKEPSDPNDERLTFPDNSLYEVSVEFDDEYPPGDPSPIFVNGDGVARVVVTACWPRVRATTPPSNLTQARKEQRNVKLVSFIRYNK